jgi:hypothetical protein
MPCGPVRQKANGGAQLLKGATAGVRVAGGAFVHGSRQPRRRARAALAVLGALCAACTPQQAAAPEGQIPSGAAADIRITDVVLGTEVGLDKRVPHPADVFGPEDTVYVSVVTEGRSSDTLLAARWMRAGRVLGETSQSIAPDGSATSEFHVSKPGGFEAGEYEVEILVEGQPVQKRRFTVR